MKSFFLQKFSASNISHHTSMMTEHMDHVETSHRQKMSCAYLICPLMVVKCYIENAPMTPKFFSHRIRGPVSAQENSITTFIQAQIIVSVKLHELLQKHEVGRSYRATLKIKDPGGYNIPTILFSYLLREKWT